MRFLSLLLSLLFFVERAQQQRQQLQEKLVFDVSALLALIGITVNNSRYCRATAPAKAGQVVVMTLAARNESIFFELLRIAYRRASAPIPLIDSVINDTL